MNGPDLPRRPDGFVAMEALPEPDASMTSEADQFLSRVLHRTQPDLDDAVWRMLTDRATDPSTPPMGPELIEVQPAAEPTEQYRANHDGDANSTDPVDDWEVRHDGFDGSMPLPMTGDTGDFHTEWFPGSTDRPDLDDDPDAL